MYYIAVDPGKVSGVAIYEEGVCTGYEIPAAFTAQFVEERMRTRWDLPWETACERYTITPGPKTSQDDALKVMGALEYVCQVRAIPFVYYTPGIGKSKCDNALLRKLGWWQPTKDGHANDAKRIMIAHLSVRVPEVYARLVGI